MEMKAKDEGESSFTERSGSDARNVLVVSG